MRFLLYTATFWTVLFLGVVAFDVGYTLTTGTQASPAVTRHIDFTPDDGGLLGWMERLSREMDRMGDAAFGRYEGLFEMALYGVVTPLLIVVPLAWEAHRRRWSVGGGLLLLVLSGLAIGAWLVWKYPDPAAVYYALVNAALRSSQAIGVSYYTGCLLYFVVLPVAFAVGYGGVSLWRLRKAGSKDVPASSPPVRQRDSGPASERGEMTDPDDDVSSFPEATGDWRLWNVRAIGVGLFIGGALGASAIAFLVTAHDVSLTYTYWGGEGIASSSYRANNGLGIFRNLSLGAFAIGIGIISLSVFTGIRRVSDVRSLQTPSRLGVFVLSVASYLFFTVAYIGANILALLYHDYTGQHWVGLFAKNQIADSFAPAIVAIILEAGFLLVVAVFVTGIAGIITYGSDAHVPLFEPSPGWVKTSGHFILYGIIWGGILLASLLLIGRALSGDFLTSAVLTWGLYAAFCLRAMEARRATKAYRRIQQSPTDQEMDQETVQDPSSLQSTSNREGTSSSPSSRMLLLGVVFAVSSIGFASCPSGPEAASSSDVLRIATVNLKAQNAEPEQAAAALAGARPDVLLLQEWTGRNAGRAPFREAGLQLVRSDARRGTHGSALLARPGIVQAARVVSPPWSGPCAMPLMTARLRSGGASIGLIGAHGPPPVAGCRDSRAPYLRALAALVSGGRAARSVGAIPRGTPLVVAGDLNALGWEAPLRSLTERGLTDGFDAGSWRLGPTWTPHPWLPALAAIDYLLMPAEWQAQGAWTVAVPGSDHRAVVVDVSPP